jgi:hypothetical protein
MESIKLNLRNPDFTTARRISQAINAFLGTDAARPSDPATVRLWVPSDYDNQVVNLLTDIEQLRIQPDQLARVIIDEQSGTIVMGEHVRISTVAIAQGSLTIRITESEQVSQPGPFAEVGDTITVDRTEIDVEEGADSQLTVLPAGVTLAQLVNGLNALGARLPVICFAGAHRDRRQAASVINQLGFADSMVAESEADFENLAVEWAENHDKRRAFRSDIAIQLETSPYLDAPARARDLENMIEDLWRRACERS